MSCRSLEEDSSSNLVLHACYHMGWTVLLQGKAAGSWEHATARQQAQAQVECLQQGSGWPGTQVGTFKQYRWYLRRLQKGY